MGSYGRDEDLDEYEDDFIDDQDGDVRMKRYDDEEVEEYEEEEEEVEEEPMSEEALRILKYRQKIKEQLRRKENGGSSLGRSSDQVKRPPLYNFGSFFGPSQPVISDRVAQETKALFETRHLTPKASTSQNNGKKVNSAPSTSGTKNGVSRPPHARQIKSKVEKMKQTRDYSFLLSDDADVPKPSKDPGKPKNSLSNTDTRPASRPSQVPTQRSLPSGSSARKMANGYEQTQERKPNGYEQTQQRKPNMYEQTQQRKPNGYEQTQQRKPNGYEQTQQRKPNGPPQSSLARNTQPVQKSTSVNRPNVVSSDSRRQPDLRKHPQPTKQAGPSSGNGSVRPPPGRPLSPKTPLSSNDRRMPMEKRPHVGTSDYRDRRPPISKQTPPTNGQRPPANGQRPPANGQRPPTNGLRPPVEKPRVSGGRPQDRNVNVQHSRDRVLKKENVTASNSQMRPPKQMSARPNLDREPSRAQQRPNGQSSVRSQPGGVRRDSNPNPRKRRAEEMDDDAGVDYSSIIQKMFGYNKNKYADMDDDTDDMEVGFDHIRKEESRSAKIAKREDEIELAKIMEEERLEKERMARKAKMRKMSQR